MSRFKVLVSAPYFLPVLDKYREEFNEREIELIVPEVHERLSEDELLGLVSEIDGTICGDDAYSERVLEKASRLKVIAKWGTGIDSIDLQAAEERGVEVLNTPNAFSEPVADTVLGYMLSFARELVVMDRAMKARKWQKSPSRSLSECSLGVIGVGNCGKAVLRRAHAFGMKLYGNDVLPIAKEFVDEVQLEAVSKEVILENSDFVSLNCTLNETSFHLLDQEQFQMMKSTAIVINTARGPLINEAALAAALRDKQIAGAALDVFEVEPLPESSPLLEFENVLLAPHNANSSPRAASRVHRNTLDNLFSALEKKGDSR